jgi:hypothetical protein
MKIWIVWYNNFDGVDDFNGAFSTEEKAQEYIHRFSKLYQTSFRVEESALDDY